MSDFELDPALQDALTDDDEDDSVVGGIQPSIEALRLAQREPQFKALQRPASQLVLERKPLPAKQSAAGHASDKTPGRSGRSTGPLPSQTSFGRGRPADRRGQQRNPLTENVGEAKWRGNLPADASFDFGMPYVDWLARFAAATNATAGDLTRAGIFDHLSRIGKRTGTWIRSRRGADRLVYIWGPNSQAIDNAISELRGLLQKTMPQAPRSYSQPGTRVGRAKPSGWGKGPGRELTEKEKAIINRRLEDAVMRERYKQEPSSDLPAAATGIFLWPADEIRPQDVLGTNFAVLDHIRMHYQVYITWDNVKPCFRVISTKKKDEALQDVQAAVHGCLVVLLQCRAQRKLPIELYFVSCPSNSSDDSLVVMLDAAGGGENPASGASGVGKSRNLPEKYAILKAESAQLIDFEDTADDTLSWTWAHSRRAMEIATDRTLPDLRYHRGRIDMKIYVGSFVFQRYQWRPANAPTQRLGDFASSIQQEGTRGRLFKLEPNMNLLMRTLQAEHLLFPAENSLTDLTEVLPEFTANFGFQHRRGYLRFRVFLHCLDPTDEKSEMAILNQTWDLQADGSNVTTPLELYVASLRRGFSWLLKADTKTHVDALDAPSDYKSFAASVCAAQPTSQERIRQVGELMVRFPLQPSYKGFTFFQTTSWKFRLRADDDYVVEVRRYDHFDFRSAERNVRHPTRSEWGAVIYHDGWEALFGANVGLRAGQYAKSWRPDLDCIFPPQPPTGAKNKGFCDLMDNVKEFVDFLNEAKV